MSETCSLEALMKCNDGSIGGSPLSHGKAPPAQTDGSTMMSAKVSHDACEAVSRVDGSPSGEYSTEFERPPSPSSRTGVASVR